jgi:hypothetical protein
MLLTNNNAIEAGPFHKKGLLVQWRPFFDIKMATYAVVDFLFATLYNMIPMAIKNRVPRMK